MLWPCSIMSLTQQEAFGLVHGAKLRCWLPITTHAVKIQSGTSCMQIRGRACSQGSRLWGSKRANGPDLPTLRGDQLEDSKCTHADTGSSCHKLLGEGIGNRSCTSTIIDPIRRQLWPTAAALQGNHSTITLTSLVPWQCPAADECVR